MGRRDPSYREALSPGVRRPSPRLPANLSSASARRASTAPSLQNPAGFIARTLKIERVEMLGAVNYESIDTAESSSPSAKKREKLHAAEVDNIVLCTGQEPLRYCSSRSGRRHSGATSSRRNVSSGAGCQRAIQSGEPVAAEILTPLFGHRAAEAIETSAPRSKCWPRPECARRDRPEVAGATKPM